MDLVAVNRTGKTERCYRVICSSADFGEIAELVWWPCDTVILMESGTPLRFRPVNTTLLVTCCTSGETERLTVINSKIVH